MNHASDNRIGLAVLSVPPSQEFMTAARSDGRDIHEDRLPGRRAAAEVATLAAGLTELAWAFGGGPADGPKVMDETPVLTLR